VDSYALDRGKTDVGKIGPIQEEPNPILRALDLERRSVPVFQIVGIELQELGEPAEYPEVRSSSVRMQQWE
jgi:hypothetical protein